MNGGKRKTSQTEDRTEVTEEKPGPEQKPKRQRLITEYKATVDLDQDLPEEVEADHDQGLEMENLKRKLQDEEVILKGQKAMRRSLKQKKEAQGMFLKYTEKYNFLAGMGTGGWGRPGEKQTRY